eukprot:m.148902 g.148902  ORF g.148902 m.148902 type:complete len:411 (+) comp16147_c0_seq2:1212-2444(+)
MAKRHHDESGIVIEDDDDDYEDLTPSTSMSRRVISKAGRACLQHKFPAVEEVHQSLHKSDDSPEQSSTANTSIATDETASSSSPSKHTESQPVRNKICSPHRVQPFHGAQHKAEARRSMPQPGPSSKQASAAPSSPTSPSKPTSQAAPAPQLDAVPHSDIMSLTYVDAIYATNLEKEKNCALDPKPHPALNLSMRTIVIDWMIEIQISFKLKEETLFTAVDIFDRYLAKKPREIKQEFQCCGATALWIASKFIEVLPPELADFEYVCANLYPRQHFLEKELDMLSTLDFRIMTVTPLDFLSIYGIVLQLDAEGMAIAEYLITLPLQESKFYGVRPSIRAASAAHIASKTRNGSGWLQDHSQLFKLDHTTVMMVVLQLLGLTDDKPKKYLNARTKFSTPLKFSASQRKLSA